MAHSFDAMCKVIGYHVAQSSDKGVAHARGQKIKWLVYGIDGSYMPGQENRDTV